MSGDRLTRDAASVALSSLLAAGAGLLFWLAAARLVPPARLGVQTSLLAAATTPAIVVAAGVGDAFTALLPRAAAPAAVLRHGYRLLLSTIVVVGAIAATLAITLLPEVRGSLPVGAAVLAGSVIWSLFIVQDPALTALGRAAWLPAENLAVALLRLGLLPIMVTAAGATALLVSSAGPALLAVAVLLPRLRRLAAARTDHRARLPRGTARHTARFTRRTMTTVLLSLGALTALPFAVTVVAGPEQGAVFALALSVSSCLDFVTIGFGTSLTVQAALAPSDGGRLLLAVLRRTLPLVAAGALFMIVAAPLAVRLIDPRYVQLHGALVLQLLAAACVPRVLSVAWVAVQQARRRLEPVIAVNALTTLTLFALLAGAGSRWGAVGAALSVVAAQLVLSAGAVAHLIHGRHRPALAPIVQGVHP